MSSETGNSQTRRPLPRNTNEIDANCSERSPNDVVEISNLVAFICRMRRPHGHDFVGISPKVRSASCRRKSFRPTRRTSRRTLLRTRPSMGLRASQLSTNWLYRDRFKQRQFSPMLSDADCEDALHRSSVRTIKS